MERREKEPWPLAMGRCCWMRPLGQADAGAVYGLAAGNPQYYRACPPPASLESIRRDLAALPPAKERRTNATPVFGNRAAWWPCWIGSGDIPGPVSCGSAFLWWTKAGRPRAWGQSSYRRPAGAGWPGAGGTSAWPVPQGTGKASGFGKKRLSPHGGRKAKRRVPGGGAVQRAAGPGIEKEQDSWKVFSHARSAGRRWRWTGEPAGAPRATALTGPAAAIGTCCPPGANTPASRGTARRWCGPGGNFCSRATTSPWPGPLPGR